MWWDWPLTKRSSLSHITGGTISDIRVLPIVLLGTVKTHRKLVAGGFLQKTHDI